MSNNLSLLKKIVEQPVSAYHFVIFFINFLQIPIGEASTLGLNVIETGSTDTTTNSFVGPNGGTTTLVGIFLL